MVYHKRHVCVCLHRIGIAQSVLLYKDSIGSLHLELNVQVLGECVCGSV